MIEPLWFLTGILIPAAIAAVAVWISGRKWRQNGRALPLGVGYALGAVVGIAIAFVAVYKRVQLPPREAHHWIVVAGLPAAALMAIFTFIVAMPRWLLWTARAAVYGGMPLVYFGSMFKHWTPAHSILTCAITSAALALLCEGLRALARRNAQERMLPIGWIVAAMAMAITTFTTGSQSLGQLGLGLTAVIAGAWLAGVRRASDPGRAALADVMAMIYVAVLAQAHLFSDMSLGQALALFFAPLLAWVAEAKPIADLGSRKRAVIRILLVAIPVAIVAVLSGLEFAAELERTAEEYR